MAVHYVKGRSTLGTLGSLASLGGMIIPGAQWLTPLGAGLGVADSLINGDIPTAEQAGSFSDILKNMMGWSKPTDGNIASKSSLADFANKISKTTRGGI